MVTEANVTQQVTIGTRSFPPTDSAEEAFFSTGTYSFYGGPGNDKPRVAESQELLGVFDLGPDNDEFFLSGNSGDLIVIGGTGDDVIASHIGTIPGSLAQLELYGGDGNDRLWSAPYIDGGPGDDEIYGTEDQDDQLFGGDDRDTILGLGGGDLIDGGEGDDSLYGCQRALKTGHSGALENRPF